MSSATEDDARWRAWMRALPSPDHPKPQAVNAYLTALQKALEARPAPVDGLSRDVKGELVQCLVLHQDIIAYELDREAAQLASGGLGERVGDLAGLLGAVLPEAKAGGAAVKFLSGSGRKRQQARLKALQQQALGVRKLLLLMRQLLITAP